MQICADQQSPSQAPHDQPDDSSKALGSQDPYPHRACKSMEATPIGDVRIFFKDQFVMNKDILEFLTIIIGAIAERLDCPVRDVYRRLKSSKILDDYMIPCYDVLHTFSIAYVVDDVVDFMKREGVLP